MIYGIANISLQFKKATHAAECDSENEPDRVWAKTNKFFRQTEMID